MELQSPYAEEFDERDPSRGVEQGSKVVLVEKATRFALEPRFVRQDATYLGLVLRFFVFVQECRQCWR
jgi:hypothetical protein